MASDSDFWLPYHAGNPTSVAAFPIDFPYELTPSAVHSPVESVLGSNETDSTGADDGEEDFLAALTQRLTQSTLRDSQKLVSVHKSDAKMAMAGSPQSTLSGFGSWSAWSSVSSDGSPNGPSQAPSPPTTPFGGDNNTWELIYAAAGQVARLKMNTHRDGVIGPSQSSSKLVSFNKNDGFYSHGSQFRTELPIRKQESGVNWGRQVKLENHRTESRVGDFHHENGRFVVRPVDCSQSGWPSLPPHHRRNPSQPCAPAVPAALHGGRSAPKKECAGTGVFLPRRYDSNPPQSRRKADCGSIGVFPERNVHDSNRSVPQTTSIGRLPPSYEAALMAERNAIFLQQRLNYPRPAERGKSHEFLLPQEWTY